MRKCKKSAVPPIVGNGNGNEKIPRPLSGGFLFANLRKPPEKENRLVFRLGWLRPFSQRPEFEAADKNLRQFGL